MKTNPRLIVALSAVLGAGLSLNHQVSAHTNQLVRVPTVIDSSTPMSTPADVVAPPSAPEASGDGETLIVVINSVQPNKQQALSANTANFGEFQGFYVERAGSFGTLNVYEITSPAVATFDCSISTPHPACLPGDKSVKVAADVRLEQRSISDLESKVSNACQARVDTAPCLSPNVKQIISSNGSFPKGAWLELTAFRTIEGAEDFLTYLQNTGQADLSSITVVQAAKSGPAFVGLGQERRPDGAGPLLGPLPEQETFQRHSKG